jgi:hypothetical protein
MDCFYCLSLWIAAPLGVWVARDVASWVMVWLGASGLACLLDRWTGMASVRVTDTTADSSGG